MRSRHLFQLASLALALTAAATTQAATGAPAGWPAGYAYHDYSTVPALLHQASSAFALQYTHDGWVKFDQIPLQDATFVRVFGTGQHKIAMYADPNCKETQAWEKWANKHLKDATVYTFAIPLIHGDDDSLSQQFVCRTSNQDRAHAWEKWLFTAHKPSPIPDCHSALPLSFAHALRGGNQKITVGGTTYQFGRISPFFVSESGRIAIGDATGPTFYSLYRQK